MRFGLRKNIAPLLLLVASAAQAQLWSGPAAVEIRVEDQKGPPVAGATLTLRYNDVDPKAGPEPVLTDAREGLFPEPRELALDCSCPDSAEVCKHVAAVLYGIAVRLDARPELFFDLRQVDQAELISSATAGAGIVRSPSAAGKRIAADRLSSVFGIDLETAPSATRRPRRRAAPARKSP